MANLALVLLMLWRQAGVPARNANPCSTCWNPQLAVTAIETCTRRKHSGTGGAAHHCPGGPAPLHRPQRAGVPGRQTGGTSACRGRQG